MMVSLVLLILALVFASASSNFTGNNISLSCIREFYSDKGYGEDVTEFCSNG